jgi:CheY-like chemotaxis protein
MVRRIVLVEDSPADAKTLRIALMRKDPELVMLVLDDGARAIEYFLSLLGKDDPLQCDLILLDLNLPRVSGFEVLGFLKTNPALKHIPVVVLSGSSSQSDITRCYEAGANSYICKPVGIEGIFSMAADLVNNWLTKLV